MKPIHRSVSLHPYFKVHPGHLDAVKDLLREFVARTRTEEKVLYYEFTLDGDMVFCREAYTDGDGTLAHLANVTEQLGKMLQHASVARLEGLRSCHRTGQAQGPLGAFIRPVRVRKCGLGD